MIRTSKHLLSYSNTNKLENYKSFVTEMRRIAKIYVDYLWNTHYEYKDNKGNLKILDIKNNQMDVPPYFDYNLIKVETKLSARALSSLITQCCGIVKACTEKHRRIQFIIKEKQYNNEKISDKLLENLEKTKPSQPETKNINMELSSKCLDYQKINSKSFEGYLRLKCLGKSFGFIKIPIKFHKQSNKWKKLNFEMLNSFLLSENKIEIRWKSEVPIKSSGITVGADQGKNDVLTLSDGQVTPKFNKHGKSLDSILDKLTRRKRGSKNFKQAQDERKNFVNYSINKLNLSNIRKMNLEEIKNITYKKRYSRKMVHWLNTLIRDKTKRFCEELGVQVAEQSSAFRSQRCSCCGIVLKRNRKGKEYFCTNCGHMIDADLNASINHEIELPEVPFWLSRLHLNLTEGFFWKPEGFFDVNGEEFRVPHSQEKCVVN